MKFIKSYKLAVILLIVSLHILVAYEISSRPYQPFIFKKDRHEIEDAKFEPELIDLVRLSLPRVEELAYTVSLKSQYIVGLRYQFGVEAFPDYDRARLWYQRSAKNGDPAGMYWLAAIDHSLSKKEKEELVENSAELGYWRARRSLLLRNPSREFTNTTYEKFKPANDIPKFEHQDFYVMFKKAEDLYRKKLMATKVKSIDNLYKIESSEDSLMYDLFKTAALGGVSGAQFWLGQFYEDKDPEQSERWFLHSAYKSNAEAMVKASFIQSGKFFTKERLELGQQDKSLVTYYNPSILGGDKKEYARLTFFWQELAGENGYADWHFLGLRFYERWPIERIVRECKSDRSFTQECIEKFRSGVLFGKTFLTNLIK